jgi:hypothetical protein
VRQALIDLDRRPSDVAADRHSLPGTRHRESLCIPCGIVKNGGKRFRWSEKPHMSRLADFFP